MVNAYQCIGKVNQQGNTACTFEARIKQHYVPALTYKYYKEGEYACHEGHLGYEYLQFEADARFICTSSSSPRIWTVALVSP